MSYEEVIYHIPQTSIVDSNEGIVGFETFK